MATISIAVVMAWTCLGQLPSDPSELLELLESLQPQVLDYSFEFEGTSSWTAEGLKDRGVSGTADAPYKVFSGRYTRTKGGDASLNMLKRDERSGQLVGNQVVIRAAKDEAEEYTRVIDAPIGGVSIRKPSEVRLNDPYRPGILFAMEDIRGHRSMGMKLEVGRDDKAAGNVVVLTASFPHNGQLWTRHWLDLDRGGHAVRREQYGPGDKLLSIMTFDLKSFQVEGQETWMPVAVQSEGYISARGEWLQTSDVVLSRGTLYVVNGTIRFNQRPGPQVFETSYRPGTPVSDALRKMQYEFGQQKLPAQMTNAEAEKALEQQVAEAERQRKELAAVPPTGRWKDWMTGLLGLACVGLLVAVVLQRRAR